MSVRRISTGRVVLHPSPIFFSSKRRPHATFIASQRIRFSFNQHGYERLRAQLDRGGIALVGRSHDNRVLWWTKPARNVDALYWAPAEMTGEEVALVIWERNQRETSRLDRIRKRKDRHDDPARPHVSASPPMSATTSGAATTARADPAAAPTSCSSITSFRHRKAALPTPRTCKSSADPATGPKATTSDSPG